MAQEVAPSITHGDSDSTEKAHDIVEVNDECADDAEMKAPPTPKPPLKTQWNFLPCILFLILCCTCAWYLRVRLLAVVSGPYINTYGLSVLCFELLGLSAFLPYALLITRGVYPTGSPGLPSADDSEEAEDQDQAPRFHVRILIPCYKEPLEVVAPTVLAALATLLPSSTTRSIYLLDDGNGEDKRQFVESLDPNHRVTYISGRKRTGAQINGKSENLNHALRIIYSDYPKPSSIPASELVVVFDSDMRANPDFLLKTLEVMVDSSLSLVLTPQAFHNINILSDLFNSNNRQFWEYWLPGAAAWGYVACTGTNFMIRAASLASCGWFPVSTITEDYALGMELKKRGHKATYLMEYLSVGEAPEAPRQVFQQRSRWTKGHYQVFFSSANPFLCSGLPLSMKFWYSYAAWAPFVNTICTPVFFGIPFMSIFFGIHPIGISYEYVLASTLFFTSILSIQFYVRSLDHLMDMWLVNISNTVLWMTYLKAFLNTLVATVRGQKMTFKVTEKKEMTPLLPSSSPSPFITANVEAKVALDKRPVINKGTASFLAESTLSFPHTSDGIVPCSETKSGQERPLIHSFPNLPELSVFPSIRTRPDMAGQSRLMTDSCLGGDFGSPSARTTMLRSGVKRATAAAASNLNDFPLPRVSIEDPSSLLARKQSDAACPPPKQLTPYWDPPPSSSGLMSPPLASTMGNHSAALAPAGPSRFRKILRSFKPAHLADVCKMTDPLCLLVMFVFCIVTFVLGVTQLVSSVHSSVTPSFVLGSPISGSPFLIIATLWALYNAIPSYLFLHYLFSFGPSFRFMTRWLCRFSTLLLATSMVISWLMIPRVVSPEQALSSSVNSLYLNSIAADTNLNFAFYTNFTQSFDVSIVGADLTGGLLTASFGNVKQAVPIAYTISMLSLALIKFPSAFKGPSPLLVTLREGAEYLMRCDLSQTSSELLYAAVVGNASDAIVMSDPGYNPVAQGKIWTSPSQDPHLVGDKSRPVWLITGSEGADLLSDVSAALASVSMVFRDLDPSFADLTLSAAKRLFSFASSSPSPQSYCRSVPCVAEVKVQKDVTLKPIKTTQGSNSTSPVFDSTCYFVEWQTKTCRLSTSMSTCYSQLQTNDFVFKKRIDCCNILFNQSVTPQGLCALPDGEFTCYIPDPAGRTCYRETISNKTGEGCSGSGLQVFPNSLSCCSYLSTSGAIAPDQGFAGSGMCSREALDPDFTNCWVPSVAGKTCVLRYGAQCEEFGVESSFDSSIGCCNRLAGILSTNAINAQKNQQIRRGLLQRQYPSVLNEMTGVCVSPPARRSAAATNSLNALVDPTKQWVAPSFNLTSACATTSDGCQTRTIEDTVEVPIFNSSSVYDDLAYASTWLFMATSERGYLGKAQRYLRQHYSQDISAQTLLSDRSYYSPSWDNQAWATNVLLAGIVSTGKEEYSSRLAPFFNAWVFGDSIGSSGSDYVLPLPDTKLDLLHPSFENVTDEAGETWVVISNCLPTHAWEVDCFDGIDDDCNGFTDRYDIACGLFPVQYTARNLAFSSSPALPTSAAASFLAMLYSQSGALEPGSSRTLDCWALGQATYMLGGNQDLHSFVVGVGVNPPSIVQHPASSCPLNKSCDWDSGLFASLPNPALGLIEGALVWGPANGTDSYDGRRVADDTRTRLEDNAGFTGLLAGLIATQTSVQTCYSGHGYYQTRMMTKNVISK